MKIDELKRIAKENDYKLENKHNQLEHKLEFRRNAGGLESILNQIAIREGIENCIFFDINYCDEKDFNMIKAAVEFAETPLEDREEEKKFYLKHRWVTHSVWYLYLYRDKYGRMGVSRFTEDIEDQELGRIQVKFTLNEIEEIKEKFNTDLADFELVEVVDEKM